MDKTDNKLIIRPKDDKYVTMTIRTEENTGRVQQIIRPDKPLQK